MTATATPPARGHVSMETVPCPVCGGTDARLEASGPDYDCHTTGDQQFHLQQCTGCTTYYLNPRPTVAALPQIYASNEYYSYDFLEEANPVVKRARLNRDQQKVEAILQAGGGKANELRVLDIGAGDGGLLEAFQLSGTPGDQLYGAELDEKAVAKMQRKGFHGLQQRAEELSFPAATFSAVTMIQVIEHVAQPRELLQTLHGMMAPGGVLLLETPNMQAWDRPLFRRDLWGGYHFPRHWTMWDRRSIQTLLDRTGFELLSLNTLPAAVIWVWSINHLLQRWFGNGRLARFFSMYNPLALGPFWLLELLPSKLGWSGNMRVIARRKEAR